MSPNNHTPASAEKAEFNAREEVLKSIKSIGDFKLYKQNPTARAAREAISELAMQMAILGKDDEVTKLLTAIERDNVQLLGCSFELECDESIARYQNPAHVRSCRGDGPMNVLLVPAYLEQKLMMALASAMNIFINVGGIMDTGNKPDNYQRDDGSRDSKFAVTNNNSGEEQYAYLQFRPVEKTNASTEPGFPIALKGITYHTIDGQKIEFRELVQNKKLFIAVLYRALIHVCTHLKYKRASSDITAERFAECFRALDGDVLGYARSIDVVSNKKHFMEDVALMASMENMDIHILLNEIIAIHK